MLQIRKVMPGARSAVSKRPDEVGVEMSTMAPAPYELEPRRPAVEGRLHAPANQSREATARLADLLAAKPSASSTGFLNDIVMRRISHYVNELQAEDPRSMHAIRSPFVSRDWPVVRASLTRSGHQRWAPEKTLAQCEHAFLHAGDLTRFRQILNRPALMGGDSPLLSPCVMDLRGNAFLLMGGLVAAGKAASRLKTSSDVRLAYREVRQCITACRSELNANGFNGETRALAGLVDTLDSLVKAPSKFEIIRAELLECATDRSEDRVPLLTALAELYFTWAPALSQALLLDVLQTVDGQTGEEVVFEAALRNPHLPPALYENILERFERFSNVETRKRLFLAAAHRIPRDADRLLHVASIGKLAKAVHDEPFEPDIFLQLASQSLRVLNRTGRETAIPHFLVHCKGQRDEAQMLVTMIDFRAPGLTPALVNSIVAQASGIGDAVAVHGAQLRWFSSRRNRDELPATRQARAAQLFDWTSSQTRSASDVDLAAFVHELPADRRVIEWDRLRNRTLGRPLEAEIAKSLLQGLQAGRTEPVTDEEFSRLQSMFDQLSRRQPRDTELDSAVLPDLVGAAVMCGDSSPGLVPKLRHLLQAIPAHVAGQPCEAAVYRAMVLPALKMLRTVSIEPAPYVNMAGRLAGSQILETVLKKTAGKPFVGDVMQAFVQALRDTQLDTEADKRRWPFIQSAMKEARGSPGEIEFFKSFMNGAFRSLFAARKYIVFDAALERSGGDSELLTLLLRRMSDFDEADVPGRVMAVLRQYPPDAPIDGLIAAAERVTGCVGGDAGQITDCIDLICRQAKGRAEEADVLEALLQSDVAAGRINDLSGVWFEAVDGIATRAKELPEDEGAVVMVAAAMLLEQMAPSDRRAGLIADVYGHLEDVPPAVRALLNGLDEGRESL